MRRVLLCCHQDGFGTETEARRLHAYLSRFLGSGVGLLVATAIPGEAKAPGVGVAEDLTAEVLLVFVGPGWQDRIWDHRDLVRRAIETALAHGVPVVPVVSGAGWVPGPSALPPTLTTFSQLARLEPYHYDNAGDNARVVERLRNELGAGPGGRSTAPDPGQPQAPVGQAPVDYGPLPEQTVAKVGRTGTDVVAFVGPTLRAPGYQTACLPLRSFEQFRQDFGDPDPSDHRVVQVALAVKAYFDNGGELLYLSRVLGMGATQAMARIPGLDDSRFEYRVPGSVGNGQLMLTRVGTPATWPTMQFVPDGTVIETGSTAAVYEKRDGRWVAENGEALDAAGLDKAEDALGEQAWFVTLSVLTRDGTGRERRYDELALSPRHPRWIGEVMARFPATRIDFDGFAIVLGPQVGAFEIDRAVRSSASRDEQGRPMLSLVATGGSDGTINAEAYAMALDALDDIDPVQIVAVPGSGAFPDREYRQVQAALIAHVERSQRLAVLELPPACTPDGARTIRARVESTRAAFFHPWLMSVDDMAQQGPPSLPPTGFVCGVLARTSVSVGLPRALTNERLRGAARPTMTLGAADEGVLVPLGINCVRLFPGAGCRLRGGRLAASNSILRFVNLRRFVDYIGFSIARGIGWTRFEPNDEQTWTRVRGTVSEFLRREWRSGRLIGNTEKEAFFVRCGTDTMTADDIDNGRLVCLVEFAASVESPCRLEISVGSDFPRFREATAH